jgi:hypothetical protein
VAQLKNLQGSIRFAKPSDGDIETEAQFKLILQYLKSSYCVRPSDPARSGTADTREIQLPFTVSLTFEERAGESLIEKIEAALLKLFRGLVDVLKRTGGTIGAGAKLVDVVDNIVTGDPDAPETRDLKALNLLQRGDVDWDGVQQLLLKWTTGDLHPLKLKDLSKDGLREVLDRIARAKDKSPSPKEDLPSKASKDAKQEIVVPPPFEVTQIFGWLTSSDGEAAPEYGFVIEGYARYPDRGVEYGSWGRFDVFGPDGSQLLTKYVDRVTLATWLVGSGNKSIDVEIRPSKDLRTALDTPDRADKPVKTVRGRLWFSDGSPFGQRTLAVYVRPAISHLVDKCCPPEEFQFKGCCGEQVEDIPILCVPQALAVTQTDPAGYFEFSFSEGSAPLSRFALLQVSGLAMPVALNLTESFAFPEPVLLQIESSLALRNKEGQRPINWLGDDVEDCGCRGIDFGTPNSAIDEFKMDIVVRTTDPLVITGQSTAQVVRALIPGKQDDSDELPNESAVNRLFRETLTRENRIRWDESLSGAQAVTISHGRILTIKQVWRADGYSLGDLRYSLPLAPLQKKNIAITEWQRSETARFESSQDYAESLNNFVGRERDVSEIVNSALKESVNASSTSRGRSGSGGFGFSLGGSFFGGSSGGSSRSNSSSSQNASRTLAASFMNRLRDQTVQAANAVRSQRVTTIQQVNQSETSRAVTETVANRNACHAMTIQYFEVLRHFRVEHELAAVRECLYIPLPVERFTTEKAVRWRLPLADYLPERYLSGIESCIRVQEGTSAKTRYADEPLENTTLEIDIDLDFPLPPKKLTDPEQWESFYGIKFDSASPLPSLLADMAKAAPDTHATYFESKIAPVLAQKYVESLRLSGTGAGGKTLLKLEPTLLSSYRAGTSHRIAFLDAGVVSQGVTRSKLEQVELTTPIKLPAYYSASVAGGEARLTTKHLQTTIDIQVADRKSIQQGVSSFSLPLRTEELRSEKDDDALAVKDLISHLNQNVEYYHKAIWWTMDADRRFALLDGYIAPHAGGRSVASVVENRLVAIIGNSLVMPVAPGVRLDYFDERPVKSADQSLSNNDDSDWLLAYYRPAIPNPATRIAVPTQGVFAESVMGSCNACEKIDNSRNWQYWQHPLPDEPTAINPLSLDSRARDPATIATPPLPPATVINQVASGVPQAPDPTGLAAAIAAVTNGSAFRDATGLAGTQQNAREALAQSYATTTRFGELGAELSKKKLDIAADAMRMIVSAYTGIPIPGSSSSSGNDPSSVKMDIGKDAAAGRITQQQAQDLVAEVNRKVVDGLGANDSSLPDVPEVREAILKGREEGSPMLITKGDSRVEIGAPTRPPRQSEEGGEGLLSRMFGRQSAKRQEAKRTKPLPKLEIQVVTAIRDVGGAFQAGEKSRQRILLDCESRTIALPEPTLGITDLYIAKRNAVRNAFDANLIEVRDELFVLGARGQTASGVYFMPDIDYRLRLEVDAARRRIRIVGSHDGFPSYTVLVNGKAVYDYEQSHFVRSFDKLLGTSDVEVNKTASF